MFWYLMDILALKRLGLGRPFRYIILVVAIVHQWADADHS